MSTTPNDDIRHQPAIQKLLERMPAQVQDSFTETQLSYLHIALGAREWGKHQLDVRGTFGFGRWLYYYVVLGGRYKNKERRSRKARLIVMLILLISLAASLVLLYLVKSALGVDLFSEFSLGFWGWVNEL